LVYCARTYLQHRKRTQKREDARNAAHFSHQLGRRMGDRHPLIGRFQECEGDALIRCEKAGGARHRKIHQHIRIIMQNLIDLVLDFLHLLRR